jgi:hypothetical protein
MEAGNLKVLNEISKALYNFHHHPRIFQTTVMFAGAKELTVIVQKTSPCARTGLPDGLGKDGGMMRWCHR